MGKDLCGLHIFDRSKTTTNITLSKLVTLRISQSQCTAVILHGILNNLKAWQQIWRVGASSDGLVYIREPDSLMPAN